jgi:dTDP-4-amino-4,6-dideoxygalactose transaminase
MTAAVPFVDLTHSLGPREELLADLAELIDSCSYTNGPHVAAFERAFADYCGTQTAVGVSSGLDALRLSFLAAGIEPGDEVVVPALTFVATWEAVTQAGGVPVPADLSDTDDTIDVAAAEGALTPRTRFLLPVHLYGQMADMRALGALAARAGLRIVEDACQAHGAVRDGARAGTAGAAAAFSFYPAKNLGAFGDAGAIVTDDEGLAAAVRALREHGQQTKYEHEREGYTARLDSIQALVLLRKLPLLDRWNAARRRAAALYAHALDGVGDLRLPRVAPGSEPVWHLYVVRTADPAGLGAFLAERGIGTARHYPQPPHLAPAYRRLGYRPGGFPVAETLAGEALSLPMFPGITEAQVAAVAGAVGDYFRG